MRGVAGEAATPVGWEQVERQHAIAGEAIAVLARLDERSVLDKLSQGGQLHRRIVRALAASGGARWKALLPALVDLYWTTPPAERPGQRSWCRTVPS
jgi:hypothetical protein